MTRHDTTTLLRELRPEATARPDEDALERLLLEPAATPPARRDHRPARVSWRPIAATGAIAFAVTVGVAALPDSQPGAPSILDRAAAAVSKPDTILHYVATTRWKGTEPRMLESWQTTDGRRERTIFNGGLESVQNLDDRTFVSFDPQRNLLTRHTDPDYFRASASRVAGIANGFSFFSETQVGDLSTLLRRAADGEDGVEQLPPAVIDGRPVDRFRITRVIQFTDYSAPGAAADPEHAPVRPATTTREIAVDRETALPVRFVDRLDGAVHHTTTYSTVESLPRTATNEQLLAMTEHPGAKTTTEGPVR